MRCRLGRILVAVAVVSWAASTALPPAEATPPGEEGRVTFGGDETSSGLDDEIYSANPDGSGLNPLTANNVDESMPALVARWGNGSHSVAEPPVSMRSGS